MACDDCDYHIRDVERLKKILEQACLWYEINRFHQLPAIATWYIEAKQEIDESAIKRYTR